MKNDCEDFVALDGININKELLSGTDDAFIQAVESHSKEQIHETASDPKRVF